MNRKTLIIILVCAAALFSALLFIPGVGGNVLYLFAFPFKQIGLGLRALADTGKPGAGAAAAILLGIGLLPLIPALNKKSERTALERISLALLSVSFIVCTYGMAYPGAFTPIADKAAGAIPVIRCVFGLCVWSAVVLCAVLLLVRLFRGEKPRLLKYLRAMLVVLAVALTAAVVLVSGGELVSALRAEGNAADKVFAVLRFIASALPYVLDVILAAIAVELIGASLADDREKIVSLAEKLGKAGVLTLVVTAFACFLFNLLQVLFMGSLSNVNVSLSIPVIDVVFVLIVLLFARLISEKKQLQDDNDLFI